MKYYLSSGDQSLDRSIGNGRIMCRSYSYSDKAFYYGIADNNGKEITPCVFQSAGSSPVYCEGLIPLKYGEHYGYLNTEGNVVIPFVFDAASNFKDGRASVCYKDYLLDIDVTGKVLCVKRAKNTTTDFFSLGYTEREVQQMIEKEKEFNLPYQGVHYNGMRGDYVLVSGNESGEWRYGLYSKVGEKLVPCVFSHIGPLQNGRMCCRFDHKGLKWEYVYITDDLQKMSKKFERASDFCEGFAVADDMLIDTNLHPVLKPFDHSHFWGDNCLSACVGQKWGMVDLEGNVLVSFDYDQPVEEVDNLDRYTKHLLSEIKSTDLLPKRLDKLSFLESLDNTSTYELTVQQACEQNQRREQQEQKQSRIFKRDKQSKVSNKEKRNNRIFFIIIIIVIVILLCSLPS